MSIQTVLGGRTDCPCQKQHPCDIRYVEIGDGVLGKLKEICAPFSKIHLVADGNTYWGTGIHSDIMTSSVRALVSAVNRML